MTKPITPGNTGGIWAPLSNVLLAASVMERLQNSSPSLPRMASLYGNSGLGKTMAAAYVRNKYNGVYVECRSFFTKKTFMEALCRELGLRPGRTIGESFDAIVEELHASNRPLLVDEVDHVVETKILEIIRDIHDASRTPIMLIGEEQLPRKLTRAERFHNRVLVWQPAQPATDKDAALLAKFYCPGVEIADDLLKRIHERSRAVARRICVNLDMVRDVATKEGLQRVDLASWGTRDFYTGDAPARRGA
jgi:hypothetical protein